MTEAELMEEVRELCDEFGLLVFHDHDSRRSWGPGYPDLTIVGPDGILFREAKNDDNPLTPEQRTWRRAILGAGGDWGLWRPRDLAAGTIRRELARAAGLERPAA